MKFVSIAILALAMHFAQDGTKNPASPPSAAPGVPAAKPQKKAPKQASMKVIVDETEVNFGANGVRTFGGRTFVPFRPLFEALGSEVEYDLVHKTVKATKGNTLIELTIGEVIGKKNGAEITMEAAPILLNKTTYVPLRFVAESLDAKVNYDGPGGIINITTKGD
jgi:hypothetical protein